MLAKPRPTHKSFRPWSFSFSFLHLEKFVGPGWQRHHHGNQWNYHKLHSAKRHKKGRREERRVTQQENGNKSCTKMFPFFTTNTHKLSNSNGTTSAAAAEFCALWMERGEFPEKLACFFHPISLLYDSLNLFDARCYLACESQWKG